MDITPLIPKGRQVITGYGNGQFKVAGEVYRTHLIVFPDRVTEWKTSATAALTLESFDPVLAREGEVDLLLVGCSKAQQVLPPKIRTALKEAGIALEIMDTGGAVRTYNVLLGEGRRVAAAVLLV